MRLDILCFLAELRFLSLPQIARLCCPSLRRDLSEKKARRQMRALFDAGLVEVLPVSRAALAPLGAANDASLLYGSAPNIYALTPAGLKMLVEAGLVNPAPAKRPAPSYGPRNSLFLAHELAVREVRVWLEEVARQENYDLECWRDGEEAAITLEPPPKVAKKVVKPDCWFVLRLGKAVLVGLVEVDRGTERGERRWREKVEGYAALFAGGELPKVTGYINARVLVVAPTERRRDQLAAFVQDVGGGFASRFWFAEQSVLQEANLQLSCWRQQNDFLFRPLVSVDLLP